MGHKDYKMEKLAQISQKQTFWALISKFFQLFILTYFFFYMFPFPLTDIPIIGDILGYYNSAIDFITIWLGENILQLNKVEKIEVTGSGDTTFDYIKLFTMMVISLLVTFIVFAFTATKSNYKKLTEVVFTYARYYLGLYILAYGLAKFFDGQFVFPDVERFEQKFGDASPMVLLWTFMGFSKVYTVFTGICEVVGGLLLFFRRTTVLGALISFMVMINVAMLNYTYDVPVKIFSTHLVFISSFIFYPNLKNLFNFFILNKPSTLIVQQLILPKKWMRNGRVLLKLLITIGIPALMIIDGVDFADGANNDKLNGAYFTQQFIINNDTLLPQKTDTVRWQKMFITDDYSKIVLENDKPVYYETNIDTSTQKISLISYNDTTEKYDLNYMQISDSVFEFTGQYKSDSISVLFKRKLIDDYPLVKRGFHWINEYPYYR